MSTPEGSEDALPGSEASTAGTGSGPPGPAGPGDARSSPPPLWRNLLVLTGGQTTTWIMALLWTLVVPRLLGPAGMGLITSVWAIAAIFGFVLALGTTSYITR
jgi:hypothetical protein